MDVSQENGATAITVSNTGKYILDGSWVLAAHGSHTAIGQQSSSTASGFLNSFAVFISVANTSPGATDDCTIDTRIEGYRVARLAWGTSGAQPITLSFWVAAARAGNYSGAVVNGAANRSYPFAFTINAASTWEYKTVVIPGDTTGTWAKDNTKGMQIYFAMMAGSSRQAAAGAWVAGDYRGVTGTINGVAATSDVFQITGVVVLPGIEAPSAARSPLIMRPYDQELLTCKRYWQRQVLGIDFQASINGQIDVQTIEFQMRSNTILSYNEFDVRNTFQALQTSGTPISMHGNGGWRWKFGVMAFISAQAVVWHPTWDVGTPR